MTPKSKAYWRGEQQVTWAHAMIMAAVVFGMLALLIYWRRQESYRARQNKIEIERAKVRAQDAVDALDSGDHKSP